MRPTLELLLVREVTLTTRIVKTTTYSSPCFYRIGPMPYLRLNVLSYLTRRRTAPYGTASGATSFLSHWIGAPRGAVQHRVVYGTVPWRIRCESTLRQLAVLHLAVNLSLINFYGHVVFSSSVLASAIKSDLCGPKTGWRSQTGCNYADLVNVRTHAISRALSIECLLRILRDDTSRTARKKTHAQVQLIRLRVSEAAYPWHQDVKQANSRPIKVKNKDERKIKVIQFSRPSQNQGWSWPGTPDQAQLFVDGSGMV